MYLIPCWSVEEVILPFERGGGGEGGSALTPLGERPGQTDHAVRGDMTRWGGPGEKM